MRQQGKEKSGEKRNDSKKTATEKWTKEDLGMEIGFEVLAVFGVYFPIFCLIAGIVLLGLLIIRKRQGKRLLKLLIPTIVCFAVPVLMIGFFFAAGALGLGPVPR